MRFNKIILLLLMLVIVPVANAQQEPAYSQYVMNGFLINPSMAGSDGYSTFSLTAREQWVGMKGAPATFAASFQTRILSDSYISRSTSVRKKISRPTKGGRIGMGGYIFSDINGIMRRTGLQYSYAYHITMNNYKQLSFGLAATAYQYYVNKDGAFMPDNDDNYEDPWLDGYDKVVYIPDANFGVSFTTKDYYIGYSMHHLFRGLGMLGNTGNNQHSELGYYYLTGGYKFYLPVDDWMVEPSVMVKSSDMFLKSVQGDISARVYYKDDYWLGLSYRTSDAVVVMAGAKFDRYYIGYACDFTLTDIRTQSFGTHELTIVAKFGDSARRYRWINRF